MVTQRSSEAGAASRADLERDAVKGLESHAVEAHPSCD
jgi:hypothetical protein